MSCFVCKRTGISTCDPQEAEVMCSLCQFCEREALRSQFKEEAK